MQQSDFDEMSRTLSPQLAKELGVMRDEGKLFTLPADEAALVLAYREWKGSAAAATTDVFTFRRPPGAT